MRPTRGIGSARVWVVVAATIAVVATVGVPPAAAGTGAPGSPLFANAASLDPAGAPTAMVAAGTVVHVATGPDPGGRPRVATVRIADRAVTASAPVAGPGDRVVALAVTPGGTRLVAVVATADGGTTVVALRAGDLAGQASTVVSDVSPPTAAASSPDGASVFVALGSTPATVVRIATVSLAVTATAVLDAGDGTVTTLVAVPGGTWLVAGTAGVQSRVVRIAVASMTRERALLLVGGAAGLVSAATDAAGSTVVFGTAQVPGQVVVVRVADLVPAGTVVLAADEGDLRSVVVDPAGTFAWAMPATDPARLVKVRLSNQTRVGSVPATADGGDGQVPGVAVGLAGGLSVAVGVGPPPGGSAPGGLAVVPVGGRPQACGPVSVRFADIAAGAFFDRPAACLVEAGVATARRGPGLTFVFNPTGLVNRAQAAAFIWRTAGAPPVAVPCGLGDVPAGAYFDAAACWLRALSISTANPFRPGSVVTRAEVATLLWRAAGSPAPAPDCSFADLADIGPWARPAACWLAQQGISTADPFRPATQVTRAQMAALLARTAEVVGRWQVAR